MKKFSSLFLSAIFTFLLAATAHAQEEFDVAGATGTVVTGINDSDYIVGYCTMGGVDRAFYYNGVDTFILPLSAINGAVNVSFMGINNVGQVVGCWNDGNTILNKAFTWSWISHIIDTTLVINSQGYTNIIPTDINDYSTIVGNGSNGTDRRFWELIGTTVQFIQHHIDGGGNVCPTYSGGVQNGGPVTGSYISNGNTFGFVYTQGNLHYDTMDFAFQGEHKTLAKGINDSGAIVLDVANGARAFVLRGGPPYFGAGDSLSRIVITGSTAVHPYDINNKFHTCGWFQDSVGGSHGFYERTYDIKFRPIQTNGDAWAFANVESNMWPGSEYLPCGDYSADPFLSNSSNWHAPVPPVAIGKFPSWPLFVEVYGQDSCYNGNSVISAKEDAWCHHVVTWNGSCFGMSCTSIMHFQHQNIFNQRFPNFTPIPYLSNNGPVHMRIDPSNQGQAAQNSLTYQPFVQPLPLQNVETVVRQLKQHMLDSSMYYPIICIFVFQAGNTVPIAAHAMVPYKIVRNPVTLNEEIFVYDPNKPRDTTIHITLYSIPTLGTYDRTWKFQWSTPDPAVPAWWGPGIIDPNPNFGVLSGNMFLVDPGLLFDSILVPKAGALPIAANGVSRSSTTGQFEFFVNDSTNFLVTDPSGDTAMFMNNRAYCNIAGAMPQTPIAGYSVLTNDYVLQETGLHHALLKANQNGPVFAGLRTSTGATLFCELDTSVTTQNHQVAMDTSLAYTNPDADVRLLRFAATTQLNNSYYTFKLSKIPMSQTQTVKLQSMNGGDELEVWNTGNQTYYALDIAVEGDNQKFLHFDSIPFISNSSHLIKFINDSSSTTGIWIIVAQGGNIIDTIFYQNQAAPILQLSTAAIQLPVSAGNDTFMVSNSGYGSFNWQVTSTPSWINITQGDTGVQQGNIAFSYTANSGNVRTGYIVVQAPGVINSPDSVKVTQSGPLGIAQNEIGDQTIMLYPNPARDEIQLGSVNGLLLNAVINIYDMDGRLVISTKAESPVDVKLNIGALSAGTYILSVKGEQAMVRKMFVKF